MPLAAADEPVCPKFQPNIFDSTRCHECLRQEHLHNTSGGEHAPGPRASDEKDTSAKVRRADSDTHLLIATHTHRDCISKLSSEFVISLLHKSVTLQCVFRIL